MGFGEYILNIINLKWALFVPLENYSKGKNVEESLQKDKIPIPDMPAQFIWMQVNGGSKMRNLLGYAMKAFKDERAIVWSGSGAGLSKAVSCAEIMKRRYKNVYQINKICYRKVEEYWEPQIEELDPLVVTREIPTIHILLSKDSLNVSEPGYQSPGSGITAPALIAKGESNDCGSSHRKNKNARVLGHFTGKIKQQKDLQSEISNLKNENE